MALSHEVGNQAVVRLMARGRAGIARMTLHGAVIEKTKGAKLSIADIEAMAPDEARSYLDAIEDTPGLVASVEEVRQLEKRAAPSHAAGPAATAVGSTAPAKGEASSLFELVMSGMSPSGSEKLRKSLAGYDGQGLQRVAQRLLGTELSGEPLEALTARLIDAGVTGVDLVGVLRILSGAGLAKDALKEFVDKILNAGVRGADLPEALRAQLAVDVTPAGNVARGTSASFEAAIAGLTAKGVSGADAGQLLTVGLVGDEPAKLLSAGAQADDLKKVKPHLGEVLHQAMVEGGWTAAQVKDVVEAVLKPAELDQVTCARLVRLGKDRKGAFYSAPRTAAFLKTARTSARPLTSVVGMATAFLDAGHVQPSGLTHGSEGAETPIATFHVPSSPYGHHSAYTVRVVVGAQMVAHVQERHTFEGFYLAPANIQRDPGASSMFAPGTDVVVLLQKLTTALTPAMNNAAWQKPPGPLTQDKTPLDYTQAFRYSYAVGSVYTVRFSQFYPKGTTLQSAHMDHQAGLAVGKLFGHIAA